MVKRAVVASALAVAIAVVGPGLAPASAAGSGSLSTGSGVLYECAPHSYSYSLSLPYDTEGWSMDVTVRSEDGLVATSDFVYDQPGTSGTAEFQLCPSDGPGTYTMSATVDYHDSDYNSGTLTLQATTFSMRQPKSRTTISATVKKNHKNKRKVVVLRTTTKDERPNGYYGTSYPNVLIQQKLGSSWRTLPNVDLSMDGGQGKVRFTWPIGRRAVLRAHTSSSGYTGSDSRAVRIR